MELEGKRKIGVDEKDLREIGRINQQGEANVDETLLGCEEWDLD
jgi:hypothetical protein